MLKIGGIYNANDLDDSVFIYLYKKNEIYYGIDILDLESDNFSKKSIENILHSISDFTISTKIHYWYSKDIGYLNLIIDGYLGEINKELYDYLLKFLYKSDEWKEYNN